MVLRVFFSIVGVLLTGAGVGIMKRAAFGIDPFQTFMSGLDALIPLPFWLLFGVVGVLLLSLAFFRERHLLGLGTLSTVFLQGYVIDWTRDALFRVFPDLGIPGRAVCFVVGILVLCVSSAMYYEADLGVSPYDSVALMLSGHYRLGPFQRIRVVCDLVCVVLGAGLLLLSGMGWGELTATLGVGTIVTAFFMGPLVAWFRERIFKPILQREKEQNT